MRDNDSYLREANVEVFGLSFDAPEKNKAFAEKYDFKFLLLSDPSRETAVAYGAAKTVDAGYASRVSYIVDEEGDIAAVFPNVNPGSHLSDVVTFLETHKP